MTHLNAFRKELAKAGADAAILSDGLNQRYLSGFPFDDGLLLVTPEQAYLLTDFRYEEAAKAQVDDAWQVLCPGRGGMLAEVLSLLGEDHCKTVFVEEATLTIETYERFSQKLIGITLKGGASAILSALRRKKDAKELETIAKAQAITDAAFSHILTVLSPEMTEVEVALELEYFMRKNGAEGLAFATIAVSGSNSSKPHGVPRPQKLEKGFLTMDFGAKYDGYCSDMTRTVVLGKADAEMKKLYNTVKTAQESALAAAHEGAICRDLDGVARKIIDDAGYEGCFGHSLGHGVGLYIHETPNLAPGANPEVRLERGHVVTFEPGIYIPGKYGCRIEDMACVDVDGKFYDFTKSKKELIELF
ncbi:MAG: aminopeptidase P family protein [Clostridia bacterium]|nr:aminopeptidase P family protein [Clostridia bacterium]